MTDTHFQVRDLRTLQQRRPGTAPYAADIDAFRTADYLDRIGAARPVRPDAAHLHDLHRRHVSTVPFENLGIHRGEPITLEPDALVDKIARERRGGICYELNGAFGALLGSLGYPVALLAARVFVGDGFGPPLDHLALRVDTPEPWLLDVGFGRQIEFPLRLAERGEQAGPGGVFRLAPTREGDLDLYRDGELQYRLELRPRALSDFGPTCWWHSHSPLSPFRRSLICSLPTPTGRITLSGRTLVTTDGGRRREEELPEDAAIAAYRDHFGLVLDRIPEPGRTGW